MKCARPNCHRAGVRRRRWLCNPHYKAADTAYVDAGPVMQHLRRLHAAGHSWTEMAALAGITRRAIMLIRDGARTNVQKPTAEAILAIPVPRRFGGAGRVDATGTIRRVRALMAIGWSVPVLAVQLDLHPSNVRNRLRQPSVAAGFAHDVAALFDRLQMTPGTSQRMRTLGRRDGWAPPFAWDEDTIDDPSATPDLGAKSTWMQEYEDHQWVCADDAQIATAMGIQLDSVKTQLRRKGAA